MTRGHRLVAALACALAGCAAPTDRGTPSTRAIPVGGTSALVGAFTNAAAATGVPAELLAALAHVETRMRLVDGASHDGPRRAGLF
ncbi:MAG: hypothetical protein KIT31_27760, partial [Deltaproteobacteria bacterium]|nr:hypothetical protein [Deltaproteobacteria bacterium]